MPALQRPTTLKEFVIQSLLVWREPAVTIVDRDDEMPTRLLQRTEVKEPSSHLAHAILLAFVVLVGFTIAGAGQYALSMDGRTHAAP
jgi:hypothetical protein